MGDVTPLLPFRPQIRSLFSSRELEVRCELRVVQSSVSSELEVRLNLPLKDNGMDIGYRSHIHSRSKILSQKFTRHHTMALCQR